MEVCRAAPPPLRPVDDGRLVSCHLYGPAEPAERAPVTVGE
jgi:hypothetical protein